MESRSHSDDLAAIEAYVASFPLKVQGILRAVRTTVLRAAPQAHERISYRMPAVFVSGRVVVYYAAFKSHIGLYPPVADPDVKARVARYAGPKGNLGFPLQEPIPHDLITAVVEARLRDLRAKPSTRSPHRASAM